MCMYNHHNNHYKIKKGPIIENHKTNTISLKLDVNLPWKIYLSFKANGSAQSWQELFSVLGGRGSPAAIRKHFNLNCLKLSQKKGTWISKISVIVGRLSVSCFFFCRRILLSFYQWYLSLATNILKLVRQRGPGWKILPRIHILSLDYSVLSTQFYLLSRCPQIHSLSVWIFNKIYLQCPSLVEEDIYMD